MINENFLNNQNYVLDNTRKSLIIKSLGETFLKINNEKYLLSFLKINLDEEKNQLSFLNIVFIMTYAFISVILIASYPIYFFVFLFFSILFYKLAKPKYNFSIYIKNPKIAKKVISRKDAIVNFQEIFSEGLFPEEDRGTLVFNKNNIENIKKAFLVNYTKKENFFIKKIKKTFSKITAFIAKIILFILKKIGKK